MSDGQSIVDDRANLGDHAVVSGKEGGPPSRTRSGMGASKDPHKSPLSGLAMSDRSRFQGRCQTRKMGRRRVRLWKIPIRKCLSDTRKFGQILVRAVIWTKFEPESAGPKSGEKSNSDSRRVLAKIGRSLADVVVWTRFEPDSANT